MAYSASDCFRLKCLRILETAGETVLTYTLKCGTDGKDPTIPLDQYLKDLEKFRPNSTANYMKLSERQRKNYFYETDEKQMRSDPSCEKFDITLLHKSIKVACEYVAEMNGDKWKKGIGEMEYLVTQIKKYRNDIVHEKADIDQKDFLDRVAELHNLFLSALEATKVRYNRDDTEFITKKDEVTTTILSLRTENLGEEEIMQRSACKLLPLFKRETDAELKEQLNKAKYLDPLHFLSGYEDVPAVDVTSIFSEIIMAKEKNIKCYGNQTDSKNTEIPYLKLLKLTEAEGQHSPQGQRPKVVLIEGEAGSGKTTFVTFLLAEWLKAECDRHMEGLHHFDLLVWVACRDQSCRSFESMLKQVLKETYIKYGNLLLPLLKQCRVLVLIDGLDEMNDTSRQLVTDILGEAKVSVGFTLLCTSRPESVQDMKAKISTNFQISHVQILGIPVNERTNLVIKHYEWLTKGVTTYSDHLRQVMERISWRELFRLPLNLLFLSTLFYCDREKVTVTITQTQLYEAIHKWCIEKLHDRLAVHPKAKPKRIFRQVGIENVKKTIYEVALKGLLHGHVYLSIEDLELLSLSCEKECLPEEEVMPAFYSMRRAVTDGVMTERYCAPHKGIQEFFAAQHIIEKLSKYKEGDIKRFLEASSGENSLCLNELKNMLCHLLGLLTRQDNPMTMAIEETVDLIRESGVRKSDDWLFQLVDITANHAAMQQVAKRIESFPEDEIIYVLDGTVHSAAALLPLLPSRKVRIVLVRKPENVEGLLQALAMHTVRQLSLLHHYKFPDQTVTSGHCLQQIPRSHLQMFHGHLDAEHLKLLPQDLQWLCLVVSGNDHARSLLPALAETLRSFPHSLSLDLHIPVAAVQPDALIPLPAASHDVGLTLSGVGEEIMEEACLIVANLNSSGKGFSSIRLPGATLGLKAWRGFVQNLHSAKVKVRTAVFAPDASITEDEASQLTTLTNSLLGCRFMRMAEKYVWGM